jgi:hypothetical protein
MASVMRRARELAELAGVTFPYGLPSRILT